jgi:hypothetical protein
MLDAGVATIGCAQLISTVPPVRPEVMDTPVYALTAWSGQDRTPVQLPVLRLQRRYAPEPYAEPRPFLSISRKFTNRKVAG